MPEYLFHGTSPDKAYLIGGNDAKGLEPRSGGGKYLCMSEVFEGTATLSRSPKDIIFRVKFSALNQEHWKKEGAGQGEWRGMGQTIPRKLLEYRTRGGMPPQTTWKWADQFPLEPVK